MRLKELLKIIRYDDIIIKIGIDEVIRLSKRYLEESNFFLSKDLLDSEADHIKSSNDCILVVLKENKND